MLEYEQSTLVGAAQRATRRYSRRRRSPRQAYASTHRPTTCVTPTMVRTPPASSCKSNGLSTARSDMCGTARAPMHPPRPPLSPPPSHRSAPILTHPAHLPRTFAQPTTPDHPAASCFVRRFSAAAREAPPPICRRSKAERAALAFCGRWTFQQRIGTTSRPIGMRGRKVENAPCRGEHGVVGRSHAASAHAVGPQINVIFSGQPSSHVIHSPLVYGGRH